MDSLVNQGYLKWEGYGVFHLLVTEKGKKFFDRAEGQIGGVFDGPFSVVPSAPIRCRVIEVTGITDVDNSTKIAEYQWNWDLTKQPQEVQDLLLVSNPAMKGTAILKLYDDGWRLQ